jgi:hypothetical protein
MTDGMPSSTASAPDRLRAYAYDPVTLLALLGSVISAGILAVFIWSNRANSLDPWSAAGTATWALLCFAPIAMLCWSALPSRIALAHYGSLRRIVQLHAVAAACIAVAGLSGLEGPLKLGPIVGVFACGALAVDLTVLAVAPWSASDPDAVERYRAIHVRIVGGTVAAIAAWSVLQVGVVVAQAEWLAWGRPYCLQVEGDRRGSYKPVRSLVELNGLKMHTPFTTGGGLGEFQFAYHAVLAVDRDGGLEWRHWSYARHQFVRHRNGKFIAGADGRPACEPRAHFAFQLARL